MLKERPPDEESPPSFGEEERAGFENLSRGNDDAEDTEHALDGQPRDKPLRFRYRPKDRGSLVEALCLHPANKQHADALEAVISAVLVAYRVDPSRRISYTRRKQWYQARRYLPASCTYTTVKAAVDLLDRNGLVGHDRRLPFHLGWQSAIWAAPDLISAIEGAPPPLVLIPSETIILKDEAKHRMDYPDSRLTVGMRRRTAATNEVLDGAVIDIAERASIVFKTDNVICFDQKHSVYRAATRQHRIFNDGTFSRGGRHYGPWWQNIPSEARRFLTIDGALTVELDFGQLHPRMAAAELGIDLGPGDIYLIPGWESRRTLVKVAINILINTKTTKSAILAIAQEIGGKGAKRQAEACVEAIFGWYPKLLPAFGTGAGSRFQRVDAGIAEGIGHKLRKVGIVTLGIHDLFIVGGRHEGVLHDAMEAIYWQRVGMKPYIKKAA